MQTQTQQLIEQVRQKLGGASDYKIAQVLDLHSEYVHRYVKGDAADAYACARIAEILDRDPLEVIAQVEAEAARTEKKRQYWRSFFSGMKRRAHVVALSAICGFLGSAQPGGAQAASPDATSHNGRLRRKPENDKSPRRGFFFGRKILEAVLRPLGAGSGDAGQAPSGRGSNPCGAVASDPERDAVAGLVWLSKTGLR